jgi:hypothetical protein
MMHMKTKTSVLPPSHRGGTNFPPLISIGTATSSLLLRYVMTCDNNNVHPKPLFIFVGIDLFLLLGACHCLFTGTGMSRSSPTDLTSVSGKSELKKLQHLVADASLDDLTRGDDGSVYFFKNGNEIPATKVSVQYLRKFSMKNDVRKSQPPHHKLSRGSTQQQLVDESLNKIARRDNGQPDPWSQPEKASADKYLGYVNRFRLANVVFSDGMKELVLGRGKTLSKDELDVGLTTDQKLYERIAEEYNKQGIDEYDRVQFPISIADKNIPSKFTEIHWSMVKKIWKDCVHR